MINFIMVIHIISVFNVILSLIFNNWKNFYNLLKLEYEHTINEEQIIKTWILAIQIRHMVSDLLYFYKVRNRYIFNHFLESIICAIVFYNNKIFTFSYICLMWAIFWNVGLIYNQKKLISN
jgi:hypothetical protein